MMMLITCINYVIKIMGRIFYYNFTINFLLALFSRELVITKIYSKSYRNNLYLKTLYETSVIEISLKRYSEKFGQQNYTQKLYI